MKKIFNNLGIKGLSVVYRYTATSIVQKWYNGQNYGLCLGRKARP